MKSSLAIGLTITSATAVDRARTIGCIGECARVLSTPMLGFQAERIQ